MVNGHSGDELAQKLWDHCPAEKVGPSPAPDDGRPERESGDLKYKKKQKIYNVNNN